MLCWPASEFPEKGPAVSSQEKEGLGSRCGGSQAGKFVTLSENSQRECGQAVC